MKGPRLRRLRFLAALAALSLVAFGCGGEENGNGTDSQATGSAAETPGSGTATESVDESELASGSSVPQDWPEEWNTIVLPTGSQGGGAYSWAVAMSNIWTEELGLQIEVQAGAGVENITLLEDEVVGFAATSRLEYAEVHGEDARPTPETTNIRDFWLLYPLVMHLVVQDHVEAEKLSDLIDGPTISIGAPGTGEYSWFVDMVECGGWDLEDFNVQALGKDESAAAYTDGLIEGWSAGIVAPASNLVEVMESNRGGKLLDIDQEVIDCMVESSGELWAPTTFGTDHYDVDRDVQSIAYYYPWVVREDVPENLVYHMARVVHERFDDLTSVFPGAIDGTAENVWLLDETSFGLHSGVVKYLEDAGVPRP